LLTTVPINLKWAGTQIPGSTIPLSGKGFPSLEPDEYIDRGLMFCQRGDHEPALDAFSASERSYVAGLALGQCLEDMGEVDLAIQTYRDIVQAHPMGRARPSYNGVIRDVTAAYPGVVLADADAVYRSLREGGVPDPDLFLDNCHMTAEGNHLVAREMVGAAVRSGVIAAAADEPRPELSIDEHIAARGWTELYTQECPWGMPSREHAVPLRSSLSTGEPPELDLVRIDAGGFTMGTRFDAPTRSADEVPHQVTLTVPVLLGAAEVTQAEWFAVMGFNPSRLHRDDLPVENVNWLDAVQFCNRLSSMQGLRPAYRVTDDDRVEWERAADGYRLPTEAEWEAACRAGSVWALPEGGTEPNPWGLSGTLGGVEEWCWDVHDAYPTGSAFDPAGPPAPVRRPSNVYEPRVARGGGEGAEARCTLRGRHVASTRHPSLGFRVARDAPEDP